MDENSLEFKATLNKFKCQQCNECCKKPGFVFLQADEPKIIAAALGLSEFDFMNDFCEIENRRKRVLKKNPDESCIFLEKTGCRIHTVKPQQCRDFPIGWRTPASFKYCDGLKSIFH